VVKPLIANQRVMIDADEIVPGLWQGSVPPQGAELQKAGFDLVVLSAREWQPDVFDDGFFEGVEVVTAPLDDDEIVPIPREDLRGALKAAHLSAEAIADGKKVLITCAAGMNRSGLISAMTMHLLYGWAGEVCMQEVREGRGVRRDGMWPLDNRQFEDLLERLPARQARYELLDVRTSRNSEPKT